MSVNAGGDRIPSFANIGGSQPPFRKALPPGIAAGIINRRGSIGASYAIENVHSNAKFTGAHALTPPARRGMERQTSLSQMLRRGLDAPERAEFARSAVSSGRRKVASLSGTDEDNASSSSSSSSRDPRVSRSGSRRSSSSIVSRRSNKSNESGRSTEQDIHAAGAGVGEGGEGRGRSETVTDPHGSSAAKLNFAVLSSVAEPTESVPLWRRLYTRVERLFTHENRERRQWDAIIALFVMIGAFTIPMRIAFRETWTSPRFLIVTAILDYIGDLLFLFDIFVRFHTPYVERGVIVSSLPRVRRHYIRGWLAADVFASLAFPASLATFNPFLHALLRLPVFVRLGHIPEYLEVWEQRTSYPFVVRVSNLLLWFVFLVHWLGCTYVLASYSNGFSSSTDPDLSWTPTDQFLHYQLWEQYIYTFFWSANQLTNTGGTPGRPNTIFEQFFELIVALVALFVVAAIIGSVGQVISEYDKNLGKFREKLDVINLFMAMKRIPEALQDRIRSHFISQFRRNNGVETDNVLQQLPINLRMEVGLVINADILKKVSFFNTSTESFVSSLAPFLRSAVFSPGDVVVKEGHTGSEMYFIGSGELKVLSDGFVIATLSEGKYFGELSLFSENAVRTATVEAATFCEIYTLSKRDLERVLEAHPKEERAIKRAVRHRLTLDLLKKALRANAFPSKYVPRDFLEFFERNFTPCPTLHSGKAQLTTKQRRQVRNAFLVFDTDGSGELDVSELDRAIATLGFDPHTAQMQEWRRSLDVDGSGTISYAEFESMMTVLMHELNDSDFGETDSSGSHESDASDSDKRYTFLPSSPAAALYFVAEGSVFLTRRRHGELLADMEDQSAMLERNEIAVVEEGGFFGAIHAGIQGVYARTTRGARLMVLTNASYLEVLGQFPHFANLTRAFAKVYADPSHYFVDARFRARGANAPTPVSEGKAKAKSLSSAHHKLRPKAKLKPFFSSALEIMDLATMSAKRHARRHAAAAVGHAGAAGAATTVATDARDPLLGMAELVLNANEAATLLGDFTTVQLASIARLTSAIGAIVSDEVVARAEKMAMEMSASEDENAMQELALSSDSV